MYTCAYTCVHICMCGHVWVCMHVHVCLEVTDCRELMFFLFPLPRWWDHRHAIMFGTTIAFILNKMRSCLWGGTFCL